MKLLIRNISRDTTESALNELFSEFGAVQSCNLVMDKQTGKSKGFAFVEMPKGGEAKVAMSKLNNTTLDGAVLRVKKAEQKPNDAKQ
ncbi:RNA-binding protein [Glaciecola sp. XM2]|jgi:RNA recognition motif-containing protein|uniref:RNA recognition motif domain-containing protein n=1 Tax=Glaciecola sp. XM2 TaxID=1914931 RepID=UPI001BDF0278|nr:RNA-binding protein [Glaciecola sp. XM2]MBT1452242.1 RNA-binding protein [Glaciecola sp. XM2]